MNVNALNKDIVGVVGEFVKLKNSGADFVGSCPFHTEKTPSFHVHPNKGIFKCFGCGESGDSIEFIMKIKGIGFIDATKFLSEKYHVMVEKQYAKPKWVNNTNLSEKAVKWFSGRGISQGTLIDMKVTEGLEWMPNPKKEVNTLQFNYFRGEELVNVKYRDAEKGFKLAKDAELIFFNFNALERSSSIIITEGEIDCLSYIEVGLKSVISVPNGASGKNLEYLTSAWDKFENIKIVYLATDNDKNGIALRSELSRRIGVDKCRMIDFKDCKDANEYLIKYGKIALEKTIEEATLFPISGVVFIGDIYEDINKLYTDGLNRGKTLGIIDLDDLVTFEEGYLTTITGIPNHGKSQYLDFMISLLNTRYQWKFGIFSPENYPLPLHFSMLAEKIIGKRFSGYDKMNEAEKDMAMYYIHDNFFFIRPEDEEFTLDNILEKAKTLVLRHGIKGLVIDPWNRIEHQMPNNGMSETNYISKQLDKITTFKQKYGVHVFVVAHPTKIKKQVNGLYEVPSLYDIAGSRAFFEKSDNGITVYRDFNTGETCVYVQKVKFKHWGKQGMAVLKWNEANGRYYSEIPDNKAWIKYQ